MFVYKSVNFNPGSVPCKVPDLFTFINLAELLFNENPNESILIYRIKLLVNTNLMINLSCKTVYLKNHKAINRNLLHHKCIQT